MFRLVTVSHPIARVVCVYPHYSVSTIWNHHRVFQRRSVYVELANVVIRPMSIIAEVIGAVYFSII